VTTPIEVVSEWLQKLPDSDVVNRLVAPDATYVSLNSGSSELKKVMPWTGNATGPKAVLDKLGTMFTRWENQAFNVSAMFGSDENVAVFGDFPLQAALAGQGVELAVLDLCESGRRAGDLPSVPRRHLRHGFELPQGRLLDHPDRA
jgi:hypothetical protein